MRLVGLGRRWRQTLDGQLAADGLSDAAWTPLVHLLRLGDGLSQSELAAAVGIDGSSLVRLLDLLVSRGWIERRAHAQDRLFQMTVLRRAAQGRLAEIYGERALAADDLARRIGDAAAELEFPVETSRHRAGGE